MSWWLLLTLAASDAGIDEVGELRARTEELEDKLLALESRLAETEGRVKASAQRMDHHERFKVDLGGYADFGFFAVQGNGSGVRKDLNRDYLEYSEVLRTWVLIGDPLSTAINSRGDSADLGDSRALDSDSLQSRGRPTFLMNALNLRFAAQLDDTWFVNALVDFLPRERAFARSSGETGSSLPQAGCGTDRDRASTPRTAAGRAAAARRRCHSSSESRR